MEVKVNTPQINENWLNLIEEEFEKPYFLELKKFLLEEKKKYIIFPKGEEIFSAFNLTPFQKIKVVIIGQDPYHGDGQAHGLSFSVPKGIAPPPSLKNIYKELENDLGIKYPGHGNLQHWAEQGVLMLNATLTVRKQTAGSHQNKGWEKFTDAIIKTISNNLNGVVFLLWGNYAKNKGAIIDKKKHHILLAAHPSPFSAHNGFFGCKHFSTTNKLLSEQNKTPIVW